MLNFGCPIQLKSKKLGLGGLELDSLLPKNIILDWPDKVPKSNFKIC